MSEIASSHRQSEREWRGRAAGAATAICCPCGSTARDDLGECRALSAAESGLGVGNEPVSPGRLYHCRTCALLFRAPALTPAAAHTLYAATSGADWQYGALDSTAWRMALSRMQTLPPGRILDIGSFDGRFLSQAPDSWGKAAIEPNPAAVARLRALGIDAIQGTLTADVCRALQGRFDVVTMFDVFEHLHDPQAGLALAASCVRPGGMLYVSTGNADHWTWRLLEGRHPYLATAQHIVVGSETWFRRRSAQQGWPPPRMTRISHRVARLRDRLHASVEAVYFGARRRGWPYRGLVHALHVLPATRRWLHRTDMPHIAELRDHLFVEISL